MATSSKTPTASGISRLLSAAGFERSESSTTRIRGWHNHSEGFSVTTDYVVGVGDCISVSYNRGRLPPSEADRIRPGELASYAEAIASKGYSAEVARDRLIVTALTAKEGD